MQGLRVVSRKLWIVGAVLLIVCAAGTALSVAVRQARDAGIENSCTCRMCEFSHAFARYYEIDGSFPPEHSHGADGKRGTWKQLLGETDQTEIDFSCPSKYASFSAVCGPGSIFDGPRPTTPDDVADGCGDTLVLVEFTLPELARAGLPQVQLDALEKMADSDGMFSATSIHPGGRGLVFADCMNFRLIKPISAKTMRALLTRGGGESITREQLIADGFLVHVGWYAQIP